MPSSVRRSNSNVVRTLRADLDATNSNIDAAAVQTVHPASLGPDGARRPSGSASRSGSAYGAFGDLACMPHLAALRSGCSEVPSGSRADGGGGGLRSAAELRGYSASAAAGGGGGGPGAELRAGSATGGGGGHLGGMDSLGSFGGGGGMYGSSGGGGGGELLRAPSATGSDTMTGYRTVRSGSTGPYLGGGFGGGGGGGLQQGQQLLSAGGGGYGGRLGWGDEGGGGALSRLSDSRVEHLRREAGLGSVRSISSTEQQVWVSRHAEPTVLFTGQASFSKARVGTMILRCCSL